MHYSLEDAAKKLGISRVDIWRAFVEGAISLRAVGVGPDGWAVTSSEIERIQSLRESASTVKTTDDTATWLQSHYPRAERWWALWLSSCESLRIASELAPQLPGSRGASLLREHQDAERSASLGYLSELIIAYQRAEKLIEASEAQASNPDRSDSAHRLDKARIDRLNVDQERLADLIAEVRSEARP